MNDAMRFITLGEHSHTEDYIGFAFTVIQFCLFFHSSFFLYGPTRVDMVSQLIRVCDGMVTYFPQWPSAR